MIRISFLLPFLLFSVSSLMYPEGDTIPGNKRSANEQSRGDILPLTWSKYELNEVSSITGGTFHYGQDAEETKFKNESDNFRILHIASHTVINDVSPDLSYISFAPEDKKEDGRLNVFEIYNLKIRAEMVILSSCNTGLGKMITGEGAFSLARAFMYAGCPSIVMSLWDIDDRATSEIVVGFYKNLSQGASKDEALRKAKLTYLKEADQYTANPLFWGGLVSIGNQANINIERKAFNWILPAIFLSLLLVSGGTFLAYRKRELLSKGQSRG